MLMRRNGRLAVSKAVRTWTKIKIIKVNKRRNCAEIEIDAGGMINKLWLGFEMVREEEFKLSHGGTETHRI
jgi:hypothetical protein